MPIDKQVGELSRSNGELRMAVECVGNAFESVEFYRYIRIPKLLDEALTALYRNCDVFETMAYLRARGIQCYGIGPAIDVEDGPLGFGAHSDQERILESEILRFARFNWDLVVDLARAK